MIGVGCGKLYISSKPIRSCMMGRRIESSTRMAVSFMMLAGCRSAPLVDPDLASEIARIKAIDNHAHPVRVMPKGQQDRFFDALPEDNMEPASDPLALRPG